MLLSIFDVCRAQTIEVSGRVTSEEGEPLIGVTVVEKGTQNGTLTGPNGTYVLKNVYSEGELKFSFIGYKDRNISIKGRRIVNIELKESTNQLKTYEVIGFGRQEKETVTGAIVSVNNEDLEKAPVSNISSALAGRLPGLIAVQGSGEPGKDQSTLKIRGIGNLSEGSGSDPLILVDGIPREDMNSLDAHAIERITVLKDASATAIYGVRGANGVILITTKTGVVGKPSVSFSSSISAKSPTGFYKFLDPYHYALLKNEGLENDGLPEIFTPQMLEAFKDGTNQVAFPTRESWLDDFIKPIAWQKQYNLNASGGTKRVKYFLSLGYFDQDGSFHIPKVVRDNLGFDPNPKLKRYNFRANVDIDLTNNLSISIRASYIDGITNYSNRTTNELMDRLMQMNSFSSPGVIDGKLIYGYLNDPLQALGVKGRGKSPYFDLVSLGYQKNKNHTLNTGVEIKEKLDFITKGLYLRVKGAYDDFYSRDVTRSKAAEYYSVYFFNAYQPGDYELVKARDAGKFGYSVGHSYRRKFYLEGSINYDRNFGKHKVTGLALYNQVKQFNPSFQYAVPKSYLGVVGRVTYSYNKKYLAEFDMGYNGSENFPKGSRFGFFPAYSVGWVPTLEPFFPENDILTFLKIKGSYGIVGNDKIGGDRFLYLPSTYQFLEGENDGYYFGLFGVNRQHYTGSAEDKIGNPLVTWERAAKTNLGIEAKLFNDRLSLEGNLFKETRDNILIHLRTVPTFVAANVPPANVGKVKNKGFEFQANWNGQIGRFFTYSFGGNISYAKNKVIFADEPLPKYPWLAETGFSLGQYKAKRTEGLYNTINEVNNRPFYTFYGNLVRRGDIKYVDVNGDGRIDYQDEVPTGFSDIPEVFWGVPIDLRYKNIEFSILFQGAGKIWGSLGSNMIESFRAGWRATTARYLNRWNMERYKNGDKITMPRLSAQGDMSPNGTAAGPSDYWMINKAYTRIKNAQIAYTFNLNALKKINIKRITVYLRGNNLMTWGDMSDLNMDPERPSGSLPIYPIMKTYNFGFNVKF